MEICFVRTFLTLSVVNFMSMRATLVNVWHPIRGIMITDLSEGKFLYRLFHKVDAVHIEAGDRGISIHTCWSYASYRTGTIRK